MIRFSALLVALAIGLLVAGVAASSLPLVYVSIAVCAMAALLLAAGVLRHWPEIFGSGTKRTASPFAASRPVPSPASAGRPAVGPAAAGLAAAGQAGAGRAAAGPSGQATGPGLAGFRTDAGAGPVSRRAAEPTAVTGRDPAGADQALPAASARPGQDEVDQASGGDRRAGRKGWPSRRPAEPEPEPAAAAAAEPIHAAATDDLWDRVNEELESAGKRDSGRLSWPAGDFSIPSGMSLPTEPPSQETLGGLSPAGGEDLWQPAAGWQPPTTPHSNWPFAPPGEAASAGPVGRDTDREVPEPEPDTQEAAAPESAGRAEPAGPAEATRSVPAWDAPTRAAAGRGTAAHDEAAGGDGAPDEADSADQGAAPTWMIRPQAAPGTESTVVSTPPVLTPPDRTPEASRPAEPAKPAKGREATEAAEPAEHTEAAGATEPAERTEAAGAAEAVERKEAAERTELSEAAEPDLAAGAVKAAEPVKAAEAAGSRQAAAPTPADKPGADVKPGTDARRAEVAAPDSAVTRVGATQVGSAPKAPAAEGEAGAGAAGAAPDEPAEQPAAGDSTQTRGTGQVQVTVVPGVARYHRSECILIRFLGQDDLEIMSKQEAVSSGLIACRACQPDQLPDT